MKGPHHRKIIRDALALTFSSHGRSLVLAGLATAAAIVFPALALADCGSDLGALMNKRMVDVAALNQITRAHGGKLDPVSACPKLRSLAATEGNVLAYMNKNKEWCSIPDDLVTKMTDSRARSASIAVKACDFAVKIKKMQEQQAQAGANAAPQVPAIKLPTGPL